MTVNEQTAFGFSGTMASVGIMGGRGDVPSYSEPRSAPRNRTNGIGKGSAPLFFRARQVGISIAGSSLIDHR